MIISLLGKGSDTFLDSLTAAGIAYEKRPMQPGVIMAGPDMIKILEDAITPASVVLAAWLHARESRKAMITMKDGKIEHVEGKTVEDVERLVKIAKKIVVIETKKPDSHK